MAPPPLLTTCAGAAAVAAAAWLAPTALAYGPGAPLLGMHRHVLRQDHAALTFDDGPHPVGTPMILAALEELGDVRATFFLVGEQVLRHPKLAQAIIDAGHEIANHGFRHMNHYYRNPLGIGADIERGADAIELVTGARPVLYRPPQGAVTPVTRIAAARGSWPVVLWSTWGRDWRATATGASVTRDVASRLRPGGIVLLHDADHYSAPGCFRSTARALPGIVQAAADHGIGLGPIGGWEQLAA